MPSLASTLSLCVFYNLGKPNEPVIFKQLSNVPPNQPTSYYNFKMISFYYSRTVKNGIYNHPSKKTKILFKRHLS